MSEQPTKSKKQQLSRKAKLKDSQKQLAKHARKFVLRRWNKLRQVRREVIYWGLILAILLIATGLQINYLRGGYLQRGSDGGGTYTTAIFGEVDTFNPLYANSYSEKAVAELIFSQLFDYDEDGQLKGDLVKSMTTSNQDKNYILTLHENVKWHDGQSVTAKDVIYTIKVLKSDSTSVGSSQVWQSIDIKQLGDYSLEFSLPSTYAPFPHALTFSILPEHLLKNIDAASLASSGFSSSPIGSGPFQLTSVQVSEEANQDNNYQIINLTKNPNYFKPVKLNRFEIHAFKQSSKIVEDVERGNVSVATGVQKSKLKNQSDVRFLSNPTYGGGYLFFNVDQAHLKSAGVRKALAAMLSIDRLRQQFNQAEGEHLPLGYPVLQRQLVDARLPEVKFADEATTNKLLAEAGYNFDKENNQWLDDKKQPFKVKLAVLKDTPYEFFADLIQKQWQSKGIKVDLKKIAQDDLNTSFVRDVLQSRDYDALVHEIQIGGDPDVFAFWHSSQASKDGLNFSNYQNVLVDDALVTARATADLKLRSQKYLTITKQWLEDVPAIGLYQTNFNYAVRGSVRSVAKNAVLVDQNSRFTNANEWSIEEKRVYKTP